METGIVDYKTACTKFVLNKKDTEELLNCGYCSIKSNSAHIFIEFCYAASEEQGSDAPLYRWTKR